MAAPHQSPRLAPTPESSSSLGALSTDENAALATTPADELLKLPMLQPDEVTDPRHAYQLAKRGNSLRVMAGAVGWVQAGRCFVDGGVTASYFYGELAPH